MDAHGLPASPATRQTPQRLAILLLRRTRSPYFIARRGMPTSSSAMQAMTRVACLGPTFICKRNGNIVRQQVLVLS